MADNTFDDPRALEEEHRAIRSLTAWIEADLESESKRTEGIRADGPLLAPLRSFHEHLVRHFEFEERCGLLEEAFRELPDAEQVLNDWKREHVDLVRGVEELIEELERASRTNSELSPTFEADLRALFQDLRRHDACENQALGAPAAVEFRTTQDRYERS